MADGVVDEVGRQPAEECFVADHLDFIERAVHRDAPSGSSLRVGSERLCCDPRQRDGLEVGDRASLRAGEHEQALEDPVGLAEVVADPSGEDGGVLRYRRRLAGRNIDRDTHRCERCSQLVRRVRDEAPLRVERALEPAKEPVDRVTQFLQLVFRARQREPLVEVFLSARVSVYLTGSSDGIVTIAA